MTTYDILFVMFMSFVAGMAVSGWLVQRKWRSNASQPFGIESGGKIYKVFEQADLDRRPPSS